MWLSASGSLAQLQVPLPNEVTPGQIISAMVMLLTMSGSLIMIALWSARFRQTGHVLPAAGRGILRVPVPLMLAGLVLGVLISLMVLAGPGEIPETASPQGSAEATDSETGGPPAAPALSRQQLLVSMTTTLTFDLVVLCLFGLAVAAVSHHGRVRINDSGGVAVGVVPAFLPENPRTAASAYGVDTRWPDLDAPPAPPFSSALPIAQTESNAGNRVAADSGRSDSPDRSPSSAVPGPGESMRMPSGEDSPGVLTAPAADLSVPEEPFVFRTELRFASEVFLAAWLPTAILRLMTVFLSYTLTGEQPGSHPFLEVMRDGIDWQVFALITFLAVFLAPLFEELLYRVVILGGIVQMEQRLAGLSVSSVVFALAHGFPDSLALLPLAFALGYTYLRRRSYVTVMLVHFLFNGFNMIIAALSLL